jgi:predicted nucleic acid-binding protein
LTLILDAGPLVALAEVNDRRAAIIQTILAAEPGELIVPAPVTAEVDYLLRTRGGAEAGRGFMEDIADGRLHVGCLTRDDHARALSLDRQYQALNLGLADSSVVVLAEKHRTNRILTLDERHFRPITPLQGGSFTLLPADLV